MPPATPPRTYRDKPWGFFLRLRFAGCMALLLALCAPGWAQPSNADLSGLALTQGTLLPAFSAGTTSYTAQVRNAVDSITVNPTPAVAGATVTVNGGASTNPIMLNTGDNNINVMVTALDGTTTQTYTVTVRRASALTLTPAQWDVACRGGSNGVLSVSASGGTPAYTYLWSTGSSLQTITGQPAGSYSVTVTDALGDQGTRNYTLNQPATAVGGSISGAPPSAPWPMARQPPPAWAAHRRTPTVGRPLAEPPPRPPASPQATTPSASRMRMGAQPTCLSR